MTPKGRVDSVPSARPMLIRNRLAAACWARSSMVVLPSPASPTMNRLLPRPSRAADNRCSIAPSVPSRSQIDAWSIPLLSEAILNPA